ncbi:MAG: 4Fe-4S binding protein [Planctomycetota bacterium]|jgi:polyferredoxin
MNLFLSPRTPDGWRKTLARALRKLGPTWSASPVRRTIQVLSLALYMVLFLYVAWPHVAVFNPAVLSSKEFLPAELYLLLDPLASLSAALAARTVGIALVWTAGVLAFNVLMPRGFCGYLCPLGTLVDFCDWLIFARIKRFQLERRGWWVHLRYFLLAAVAAAATVGVMFAGFFAAIPVLNRGLRLSAGALQLGFFKRWDALRPFEWTSYVALAMLVAVFALGLLAPRFWCRYVCPTGGLFSLASFARLTGRKVDDGCNDCRRCEEVCPFDAVKSDHATRAADCASCQTCGGACSAGATSFPWRWNGAGGTGAATETADAHEGEAPSPSPLADGGPRSVSRRTFLASGADGVVAAVAVRTGFAAGFRERSRLIRPPGSVPESEFLDLCVRCGECMKVCPGPVLHPAGIEHGLESLWTPHVVPTWAACRPDCNFCSQVCPTGAIRPISLEEKRATAIGLARINVRTCLAYTGVEDCRVCVHACLSAGYVAIARRLIRIEIDESRLPTGMFSREQIEAMSYIRLPMVNPHRCVGCGQCENHCHIVNHLNRKRDPLPGSAIVVEPLRDGERRPRRPHPARGGHA